MIIGIDASRANREHKTGTEWYSYYLIKQLAQIDSKNQYILYSDKPLNKGLSDLLSTFADDNLVEPKFDKYGYQIIKSPHNNFKAKILRWPFSYLWTLGRFSLEMMFRRPDVLFVPAHTIPLIHPKRTITTIHDIAFMRTDNIYQSEVSLVQNSAIFKKISGFLVKIITLGRYSLSNLDYLKWSTIFALQAAKKIITVSNFTKSEIIDVYGTKDKKLKVIYNGYNNDAYKLINDKEKINEILKKYGIKGKYFLYVGRLEKKKNTARLVEAFAILKETYPEIDYKLILIGDASYGYDEIKYLIDEYGLEDKVIMLGWVKEADLPYIHNGASAFIFPTLYEGFGIPVIQALACGLPTAVSDIKVMKEICHDSVVYFNPYSKDDIACAMYNIAVNNESRHDLLEKGFKRAKDFSWRKCAEETLREIEKL